MNIQMMISAQVLPWQTIHFGDTSIILNYHNNIDSAKILPSFVKSIDTLGLYFIYHSPVNYILRQPPNIGYMWYGSKMIKNTINQSEIFININGDSIRFLPTMEVGDSMLIYSKSSNWASIICDSIKPKIINFQIDSVKYFHLSTNIIPPSGNMKNFTNLEVQLSRNLGWICAPAWYVFPYISPDYNYLNPGIEMPFIKRLSTEELTQIEYPDDKRKRFKTGNFWIEKFNYIGNDFTGYGYTQIDSVLMSDSLLDNKQLVHVLHHTYKHSKSKNSTNTPPYYEYVFWDTMYTWTSLDSINIHDHSYAFINQILCLSI